MWKNVREEGLFGKVGEREYLNRIEGGGTRWLVVLFKEGIMNSWSWRREISLAQCPETPCNTARERES
jgi:hypothetical protein